MKLRKTLKGLYRGALSLAARGSGWPVLSRHYVLLKDAGEHSDGIYFENIFPVVHFQRSAPNTLDAPLHWKFQDGAHGLMDRSEPVSARLMKQVYVAGPAGTIIDHRKRLVYDASLEIGLNPQTHSAFNRVFWQQPKVMHGVGLNLSASQAHDNYFHWMTDALPKLGILTAIGKKIADFDYFIVNSRRLPFQRKTLALLEIPEEKTIALDEHPFLLCKQLWVTTATCLSGNVSPWIIEFLRARFLPDCTPSAGSSKIFIGREHVRRRRLTNSAELGAALETVGYEPLYPEHLDFCAQVQAFAHAHSIIAAHGAALTNLVFCQPGTYVLELFPNTYINQGFWTIASIVGLRYAYYIGEGQELPDNPYLLENSDFSVNRQQILEYHATITPPINTTPFDARQRVGKES